MRWLRVAVALVTISTSLYLIYSLLFLNGHSLQEVQQVRYACDIFLNNECSCKFNQTISKQTMPKACNFNQRVIAYSFFGEIDEYSAVLEDTIVAVGNYLSGWRLRLYHDAKESSARYMELCHLSCKFSWVELWNMRDVRKRLSARSTDNNRFNPFVSTSEIFGMNKRLWRYLVLLDDKVDIAIMRDLDARLTQRELAALRHWLESDFTFHVMRDHQEHRASIMAGLFGVKLHKRRDLIKGLTLALISSSQNQKYDTDQRMLHRIFWPTVKLDVMAHDSYYCQERFNFLPTYPFPTQRTNFSFVSDNPIRQWVNPSECPFECRPEDHKNWIYC